MFVSVIIPVFNEDRIIYDNIERLRCYLQSNFEKYEIIAVDDGSNDNTLKKLTSLDVIVIALGKNKGKGAAVREGMKYARGDYAFFIDGDLPYPMEFLSRNISLFAGYNIVVGHRTGNYPAVRRLASICYNRLVCLMFKIEVHDVQCGIKGFDRAAYTTLFSKQTTDGFAFDTEILLMARREGFKIAERTADLNHRKGSSVGMLTVFSMLKDVIRLKKGR